MAVFIAFLTIGAFFVVPFVVTFFVTFFVTLFIAFFGGKVTVDAEAAGREGRLSDAAEPTVGVAVGEAIVVNAMTRVVVAVVVIVVLVVELTAEAVVIIVEAVAAVSIITAENTAKRVGAVVCRSEAEAVASGGSVSEN